MTEDGSVGGWFVPAMSDGLDAAFELEWPIVVTVDPTAARDLAHRLSRTDTAGALRAARSTDDPWFRAQGLAWAGRFAPEKESLKILKEAEEAGRTAKDPYENVGSSAWWLSALIELGFKAEASAAVTRLLEQSQRIEHPVRRADALFHIFQAVFVLDEPRRATTTALVHSCLQATKSWRTNRNLRDVTLMLAGPYPAEAEDVLRAIPEGKRKRETLRRLAERRFDKPRHFLW